MQADIRIKGSRVKLRDALFDCLKGKALADVTVKEVCERAGLNRITFYRNYKTLNDIVSEVERDCLEQLQTIFVSAEKSGADKIREAVKMLYEAKEIDVYEGIENLFKDFKPNVIRLCEEYALADWKKLLSKENPLDAELDLELLISGVLYVIANSRDKYTCEDVVRIILDFRDDSIKRHSRSA